MSTKRGKKTNAAMMKRAQRLTSFECFDVSNTSGAVDSASVAVENKADENSVPIIVLYVDKTNKDVPVCRFLRDRDRRVSK
eukprot:scaffold237987_cov24-Attheya_sp.AAC.1